jgi:hypothetical protein
LRAYLVRKRHGRVLWSHLWYHSGFVVSLVVPLVGAQALAEDHVSGPERGSDEAAIFARELNHTVRSVVFGPIALLVLVRCDIDGAGDLD